MEGGTLSIELRLGVVSLSVKLDLNEGAEPGGRPPKAGRGGRGGRGAVGAGSGTAEVRVRLGLYDQHNVSKRSNGRTTSEKTINKPQGATQATTPHPVSGC